ncbi:AAEL013099-PA [Aedes aegypti]|uniref:AAEL013099-PA n=1 Tax=Aedes aegypti TaxID=7159 RepID=Q16K70_AEDAE|nr:AAEL013099-PA [Aedes aegypti]
MSENKRKKPRRRQRSGVARCRLCREIKINPGCRKYNVCRSCQTEVEEYYSFKKQCRHYLREGVLSTPGDDDQPDLMLNSLLENCSEEVTLPPDTLESLAGTSFDLPLNDHNYSEGATESTKDYIQEQPKPNNQQKSTLNTKDVSNDVQAAEDPEHQESTKKLRPYRRKFRQTEEEKSMTPEEYKRYYRKIQLEGYKRVCDICGKSIDPQRMESHMNRHKGVEPYSCEKCGLPFHCRANLRKHITRSHAKGQEIACELCDKVSVSEIAHKQHLRAVHTEKKFQCTLCHVKTVTQYALDSHMDIHNQRRDYVCPHCGKAFYRRYVLNIHLRTHSGETPYKCHVCAEAFVHRRIYVMHMKKLHPEEPMMRVDGLKALKEALKQKGD